MVDSSQSTQVYQVQLKGISHPVLPVVMLVIAGIAASVFALCMTHQMGKILPQKAVDWVNTNTHFKITIGTSGAVGLIALAVGSFSLGSILFQYAARMRQEKRPVPVIPRDEENVLVASTSEVNKVPKNHIEPELKSKIEEAKKQWKAFFQDPESQSPDYNQACRHFYPDLDRPTEKVLEFHEINYFQIGSGEEDSSQIHCLETYQLKVLGLDVAFKLLIENVPEQEGDVPSGEFSGYKEFLNRFLSREKTPVKLFVDTQSYFKRVVDDLSESETLEVCSFETEMGKENKEEHLSRSIVSASLEGYHVVVIGRRFPILDSEREKTKINISDLDESTTVFAAINNPESMHKRYIKIDERPKSQTSRSINLMNLEDDLLKVLANTPGPLVLETNDDPREDLNRFLSGINFRGIESGLYDNESITTGNATPDTGNTSYYEVPTMTPGNAIPDTTEYNPYEDDLYD